MRRPLTRPERLMYRGIACFLFLMATGALTVAYVTTREPDLTVALSTLHWPRVKGVITASRSETASLATRGWGDRLVVRYSYAVDGKQYTGFRLDAPLYDGAWREPLIFRRRAGVNAKLREYPVGQPVDVWYDAGNPSRAVLVPGVPDYHLAGPGLLAFLFGAAGILGAMGIALLRVREKAAGSRKARREWLEQHGLTEEAVEQPKDRPRLR